MGDYRQDGRKHFSGGNRGGFGRRDRGPVTMHQAVCAQCGKTCEVPFRPTEGKPVYCSVCFGMKKDAENKRGGDRFPQKNFSNYKTYPKSDFGSNDSKGSNSELNKQLEALNAKMAKLIKIVEAITNVKPLVAKEKVKKVAKKAPVVKVKKAAKKVSKKGKK